MDAMDLDRFANRRHAGDLLGRALVGSGVTADRVIGLARGGVPVAVAVARRLGLRADVLFVRKLGSLLNREVAVGAVAEDGTRYVDRAMLAASGMDPDALEAEVELQEGRARVARARLGLEVASSPAGAVVLLVDDGLATGATMIAAARAMRKQQAARVLIAVPVGPPDACARLAEESDGVFCLRAERRFGAVSEFYEDFAQVEDSAVRELLQRGDGTDATP